ncbi:dTMP kinase [Streptomyces roseifaciens]
MTIDGPVGVGVTTATALVAEELRAAGRPTRETRQPSDSTLGNLASAGSEIYRGRAMAHLVAADRYMHASNLHPVLSRGEVVVCDGYVPTSLVRHVMDGVTRDDVWRMNRDADVPRLAVILNADQDVVLERLAGRVPRNRYERQPKVTEWECGAFKEVARFLMDAGWNVLHLDTSEMDPDAVAWSVVQALHLPRVGQPTAAVAATVPTAEGGS